MKNPFIFLLFSLLFFLTSCSETPRTIIIDEAGILTEEPELIQSYKEYNEQLFRDFHIDFRIITTESDEDINSYSNRAFSIFEKESISTSGRALLLVINTRQDLARLEVSMALEPIFTDMFISFIEHQHLIHFFRDNRLAIGIFATTEKIYSRAANAEMGKEFMADMTVRSIGGGAKISADMGKKELNNTSQQAVHASMDDTPTDVLEKYIQSRQAHNNNPDLDIFTDRSKAFFADWTVTPIQMDNEVHAFSKCSGAATSLSADSSHAVIIFPINERTCSPYLLKKEQGSWRLDFATMTRVIRFNMQNKWHLILKWKHNMGKQQHAMLSQEGMLPPDVETLLAPYLFAFDHYIYDINGYAFEL